MCRILEFFHGRFGNCEKFHPYRDSISEPLSRDHGQEGAHVTIHDQMYGTFNEHEGFIDNTIMEGYCKEVNLKSKLSKYKWIDFSHINTNILN
jgi:hypothetical protein